MRDRLKQFGRAALTGEDRSALARLTRLGTAAAEPAYAAAMRVRNGLYDRGLKRAHDLGRPTVSVGNVTTGGTGKTPVVAWLARRLFDAGRRPSVLLRGYGDDETRVLRQALGDAVPVQPDPSRVAAAAAVLRDHPSVDLFVLDDAFQHRRARRDLDVVLVSATDPFGLGHVLPRGLLREPLSGLGRAGAVVITRADAVPAERLVDIERTIRRHNATAPVYRADHVHAGLWRPADGTELALSTLADGPFFAVAGIGDPADLDRQLRRFGPAYAGHRWFADHHAYAPADVAAIAAAAGGAAVVTTEKDWVKLAAVPAATALPMLVLRLAVRFHGDDEQRLLAQVTAAVTSPRIRAVPTSS